MIATHLRRTGWVGTPAVGNGYSNHRENDLGPPSPSSAPWDTAEDPRPSRTRSPSACAGRIRPMAQRALYTRHGLVEIPAYNDCPFSDVWFEKWLTRTVSAGR